MKDTVIQFFCCIPLDRQVSKHCGLGNENTPDEENSLGNPKPIGHSPEVMLRFFAADAVPTDEGIHTSVFAYTEENYLHTLPPFHVSTVGKGV